MNDRTIDTLLDVGIALSKEKDANNIFQIILTAAMDIAGCDGGTLYILRGDVLTFEAMIRRSQKLHKGGKYGSIDLPPVPLVKENACARAAIDRRSFRIDDVYGDEKFDFSGPRKYDMLTGYKTVSMLVSPMEDDSGNVIGVLQLVNALTPDGEPTQFAEEHESIIKSLASLAAICLVKHYYSMQVSEMLDSLVGVLTTAIDALTPYNANHTRNMTKFARKFLIWAHDNCPEFKMGEAEARRFLLAVQLHDVGKLVTPLEVMNKDSRLGSRLGDVLERFRVIALLDKIAYMEGNMPKSLYEERAAMLKNGAEFITRINTAGFLTEADVEYVDMMYELFYTDERGEKLRWITEEEQNKLKISRGTLTGEERSIMENHVVMTSKLLAEMKFPAADSEVPLWAADHHELLDGSGYPAHKTAPQISKYVRLLTILDVFEALTAMDRPYRAPMPVKKAFLILENMAKTEKKLDETILDYFKQSRAWEA